jgi:hypothetical protein
MVEGGKKGTTILRDLGLKYNEEETPIYVNTRSTNEWEPDKDKLFKHEGLEFSLKFGTKARRNNIEPNIETEKTIPFIKKEIPELKEDPDNDSPSVCKKEVASSGEYNIGSGPWPCARHKSDHNWKECYEAWLEKFPCLRTLKIINSNEKEHEYEYEGKFTNQNITEFIKYWIPLIPGGVWKQEHYETYRYFFFFNVQTDVINPSKLKLPYMDKIKELASSSKLISKYEVGNDSDDEIESQ